MLLPPPPPMPPGTRCLPGSAIFISPSCCRQLQAASFVLLHTLTNEVQAVLTSARGAHSRARFLRPGRCRLRYQVVQGARSWRLRLLPQYLAHRHRAAAARPPALPPPTSLISCSAMAHSLPPELLRAVFSAATPPKPDEEHIDSAWDPRTVLSFEDRSRAEVGPPLSMPPTSNRRPPVGRMLPPLNGWQRPQASAAPAPWPAACVQELAHRADRRARGLHLFVYHPAAARCGMEPTRTLHGSRSGGCEQGSGPRSCTGCSCTHSHPRPHAGGKSMGQGAAAA